MQPSDTVDDHARRYDDSRPDDRPYDPDAPHAADESEAPHPDREPAEPDSAYHDTTADPDAAADPDVVHDAAGTPDMAVHDETSPTPDTAAHHDTAAEPDTTADTDRDTTAGADTAYHDVAAGQDTAYRDAAPTPATPPTSETVDDHAVAAYSDAAPTPDTAGGSSAAVVDAEERDADATVVLTDVSATATVDQTPAWGTETLLPPDEAERLTQRWRDAQASFVDDPRQAVNAADALIGDAVQAITAALDARTGGARRWQEGDEAATDELLAAFREDQRLFQRLLGF